ncbi:MAG: hypothetical protein K2N65_03505, partial [Anaeroplasmataceae bacterium]|nr:hypothetical protein [Anaeroplasmataceae bacterium]
MKKNSVRRNTVIQEKHKTMLLVFKIVILIAFIFVVTSTVLYLMEWGHENRSYFTEHFALPIVLLFVGVIAVFLTLLSKLSMSGENKGDNIM